MTGAMTDFVDYYDLLGCAPDSSLAEIKQAYHEKLREFHPDKRPNSQEGRGKRITAQLNEAWEILKDEQRREDYDRQWLKARPPAFGAAFPSVPKRGPPQTADDCRRVGNDLYRAAGALAQSHHAEGAEGITFGAEGMDWAKQVMEKYQAAIDVYTKGLGYAADDYRLLNNRALCFAAMKMWPKCKEDARHVTRLKPDFKKGWFLLAKALWKEGQLEEAKVELEAAVQLVPDPSDLHELLIEIQHALNESTEGHLPAISLRRQSMSRSVSPVATPPATAAARPVQPPPSLRRPMPPRRSPTPPSPPAEKSLGQSQSCQTLGERARQGSLAGLTAMGVTRRNKGNWRFPRTNLEATLGGLEGTARFGESTADFGEKLNYLSRTGSGVFGKKEAKTLWDLAQRAAANAARSRESLR